MSCIAIVFIYITSPESQYTYASVDYDRHQGSRAVEQIESKIDSLNRSIQIAVSRLADSDSENNRLFGSLEHNLKQHIGDEVDSRIETRFVSARSEQECSDSDLRALIERLQSDVDDLKKQKAEVKTASPASLSSGAVSSYGSTGGGSLSYKPSVYSAVSSSTVGYGSTGGSLQYSQNVSSGYGSSGSRSVAFRSAATVPVAVTASSAYSPRWQNHDGLSFRQHAEQFHGIDTTGLTDQQVAMMRDHDHDTFGPGHPPEMRATRTVSRTVQQTQSCPGGVCPVGQTAIWPSQSRSSGVGLLGFRILGRR
jgi:hypothetical protein